MIKRAIKELCTKRRLELGGVAEKLSADMELHSNKNGNCRFVFYNLCICGNTGGRENIVG